MEQKKQTADHSDVIVYGIRILVKISISLVLILTNNPSALFLTVWLVISEALDQFSLLLVKTRPGIKGAVEIFYVVNSVTVISAIAWLGDWTLNDFYLVYLIHISSSTLAYGFKIGLLSFGLSLISYSALLFISSAPGEIYIRLPLLSVIVLRLMVSQKRFEAKSSALSNILSVEKSKKDFIAIASHNLRTPVAAIYGYIEVLIRGDTGSLSDAQKSFIQKIKANNQELEKLTEQLLQVSILEVGAEVNLLKQPSQLETIIQDLVENFKPLAQTKGLVIEFEKPASLLPTVNIDVEKIRSVMLNLIDNAIKYTDKGSITVSAQQLGDFVKVCVKDSGEGIAKEELPKIFTKFYRSGNILVYNKIGVGLGLYLGKQIIELHGGKIGVESTLGQGTTFTFTLPVAKQDVFK